MRSSSPVKTASIIIGEIYAVKNPVDGKTLQRFRVSAITSTRTGNSPSEVKVKVQGHNLDNGAVGVIIPKSDLLGLYTEHKELVEKQKAEQKARLDKQAAAYALGDRARELLAKVGVDAVVQSYARSDVQIDSEHVPALVAWLEKVVG